MSESRPSPSRVDSSLGSWAMRGFWGLWDQGLFAVANFTVGVVLARFLTEESYGAFTFALTIQLAVGALYNAVFVEPMMVFGSGRYRKYLTRYWGVLAYRWHPIVSIGVMGVILVVAVVSWAMGSSILWPALLGAAVTAPFVFGLNLVRKATYIRSEQQLAAVAGLVYLLMVGSGLLIVYQLDLLTPLSAFLLVGAAAMMLGLWLLWRLGPVSPGAPRGQISRSMLHRHSSYGRWSAATSVIAFIPGNVYFLLLPIWVGLAGTAELKALLNLVLPPLHVITAISTVVLPSLVGARDTDRFKRLVFRTTLLLVAMAVLYWVLLATFDTTVIELLYAGRYQGSADLIWLAGLIPIVASVANLTAAGLRAIEKPNLVFVAYFVASGAAILIGLPLASSFGVTGAIVGMLASSLLNAVVAVIFLFRTVRRRTVRS